MCDFKEQLYLKRRVLCQILRYHNNNYNLLDHIKIMYVSWRSCGPSLNLNSRDRPILDRGKTVYGEEKVGRGDEKIKISFSVLKQPYVRDSERIEDMMLEEGWKVRSTPPHPLRQRAAKRGRHLPLRELRISVSPMHWDKLKKEGYIVTRSLYDRIDVKELDANSILKDGVVP
mgnify:CR=1 FL=1